MGLEWHPHRLVQLDSGLLGSFPATPSPNPGRGGGLVPDVHEVGVLNEVSIGWGVVALSHSPIVLGHPSPLKSQELEAL